VALFFIKTTVDNDNKFEDSSRTKPAPTPGPGPRPNMPPAPLPIPESSPQPNSSPEPGPTPSPNPKMVLYHYSVSPNWRGGVLPPGSFLTDNPSMGSAEARSKLALPNVGPGQDLYLYPVVVNASDVTPPRPVAPMKNNVTNRTLNGGGTEYISLTPLPMQPTGVPVGP